MPVIAAFLVTSLVTWMLKIAAAGTRLVQAPGAHRRHESATPIVGGLGMFAGAAAGWLWVPGQIPMLALMLAAGLALVLGLWDDLRPRSHYARFLGQIAAAGLMVGAGGVVLTDLGQLVSESQLFLGKWSVPLTIFATIGVMNAVNMSDGMDGLAGSLCLLAVMGVGAVAAVGGDWLKVAYLGPIAGALLAFLVLNLRIGTQVRAQVFMGDAGSLFLGLLMAWMFIDASQGVDRVISPVTALWLFALPLCDAVRSLIRRPAQGQSPFQADSSHYHHHLRACGLSVTQTLWVSLLTALLCSGIGIWGVYAEVPDRFMFAGFLGVFALYLGGMEYLVRVLSNRPQRVIGRRA